jgi:predicted homoserine dehydrogenase-like protein
MYRPYHLMGLELGVSIANIALRGKPTGGTDSFRGDAVATTKRTLQSGEKQDGEGGYTVYGMLMHAADSLAQEAVPIGLAHGITLRRPIEVGQVVQWSDVVIDASNQAIRVRQEMEAIFRKELSIETPARKEA